MSSFYFQLLYLQNVRAECNLTCPNCRAYIGNYCRKTARNKDAVNQAFWARIQKEFPDHVKAKMEGKDDDNLIESK